MTRPREAVAAVDILGVPIAPVGMDEAVDWVDEAVLRRQRLHVGVVNAAKLVNMRRDPELRDDVLSSDVVLADGMSVVWASRLLGRPLPERVAGIDLMYRILERGQSRGYRVYLPGRPRRGGRRARRPAARAIPGARSLGHQHGYFGDAEEEAVATAIAAAQPDVLFVAMTSPRKERFLARWGGRLGVPVCHGVGGSLDVVAGKVERAPRAGNDWASSGSTGSSRSRGDSGGATS